MIFLKKFLEYLFIIEGILFGVIGVLFFINPFRTLANFINICGVLIILAGIFSIIRAFAFTNNVFLIANGTISILFGLLLCFSPVATIDTLALFFGVWAIIRGIYLFIMAIKHKNLNFNFHTIYIILLFLLGLLILFNPLVTILATPYIIGTFFIISAVCEIYLGFKI